LGEKDRLIDGLVIFLRIIVSPFFHFKARKLAFFLQGNKRLILRVYKEAQQLVRDINNE